MAVITVILTGLYTLLQTGIPDWETVKKLLLAGLVAGIGYIIKNALTNSDDKFLTKEEPKE